MYPLGILKSLKLYWKSLIIPKGVMFGLGMHLLVVAATEAKGNRLRYIFRSRTIGIASSMLIVLVIVLRRDVGYRIHSGGTRNKHLAHTDISSSFYRWVHLFTIVFMFLLNKGIFSVGMCLLDTVDGALMMALYTSTTLAKDQIAILYYSIVLTVITVVVAMVIGFIQLLTLIQNVANLSGGFWVRSLSGPCLLR